MLLSTLYVLNSGGRTLLSSPSTNSGGRVPLFTRVLHLWLVLCLTYIAHNVVPTMKISTKCMCFFQLIILRLHPHFTRHIRKKIRKTICILHVWKSASPQIRRSAFYRRPTLSTTWHHCIRQMIASSLSSPGVVSFNHQTASSALLLVPVNIFEIEHSLLPDCQTMPFDSSYISVNLICLWIPSAAKWKMYLTVRGTSA